MRREHDRHEWWIDKNLERGSYGLPEGIIILDGILCWDLGKFNKISQDSLWPHRDSTQETPEYKSTVLPLH
jgi:hypothetical protein